MCWQNVTSELFCSHNVRSGSLCSGRKVPHFLPFLFLLRYSPSPPLLPPQTKPGSTLLFACMETQLYLHPPSSGRVCLWSLDQAWEILQRPSPLLLVALKVLVAKMKLRNPNNYNAVLQPTALCFPITW